MPRTLPPPWLALAMLFLVASRGEAQGFGRWSWQGSLGGTGRSYQNFLGDEASSSRDELALDLALGVNGFLIHPAIARFTLSGNVALADYRGTTAQDSNRWGLGGSLNVLPFGNFPLSLYANRQAYTYSQVAEDAPPLLIGFPETSTNYGGRFRMRAGPLRGTLLGYDRSLLTYTRPDEGTTVQESGFADWSRSGRRFDHHLRLNRRSQEFATLADYTIRDLQANYDLRGRFGERWRWEGFANGLKRELELDGTRSRFDNARTSQKLLRTAARGDVLELSYTGGFNRGPEQDFRSHTGLVRYQWRPRPAWTVAPFAGYGVQLLGDARLQAPQAGLNVNWAASPGNWEIALNQGVTAAWLVQREGRSLNLGFDAGVTAARGDQAGLRKTLEASWARNRLRSAGDALPELPDLGVSLAGPGTEDSLRGRLSLEKRWGSRSLLAWVQATRRQFSGPLAAARPTVDGVISTLQLSGGALAIGANLGYSRVLGPAPQSVRSWAASARWRPVRLLSFNTSYRADRRHLTLTPDVDADRVEAGLGLWVGAFQLDGRVFWNRDRPLTQPARVNRGFVLSVGRRFWGWLPWVTGVPDGTVR